MSDISKKSLTEIVKLIKKKEIKSEELTKSYIKNINSDKKLNSFITTCSEEALRKAVDDACKQSKDLATQKLSDISGGLNIPGLT